MKNEITVGLGGFESFEKNLPVISAGGYMGVNVAKFAVALSNVAEESYQNPLQGSFTLRYRFA